MLFLVNVSLTLMLFAFWKTQKTYYGFKTWMLSLLVTSCGYSLFMTDGSVPVLISSTVADLFIALSVMMKLDSTRKYFSSKSVSLIIYGTLIPSSLLLLYFTFRVNSVVIRGVIIGLLILPCFLAISLIAIRFREPETRSLRYGFATALLITALLWTMIIVRAIITPGDHSLSGPDPVNPIFFIVTILMDIVSTVFFLLLNMARSQTELRQSEERYRNLADNLPDYILVHDGEIILYANPAAARLVEPSRETLVGQSVYAFLTPASAVALRSFVNVPLNTDSLASLNEIDIQLRDGSIRNCMIKTVTFNDRDDPAFLSVITDITGQKAVEAALYRTNKKLTILSSITRHDIKNQLLALSGYLELSKGTLDNIPVIAKYLEKEMSITTTIESQIDFTKAYEDMGKMAPVWQNINESVRRAVAVLSMRDVRVDVDRSDLEIHADPLFEKVFYNLIDNALKYGGEAMTTICITSYETDTGLVIGCEDDGAGITSEDKKHLFEHGYGKHTGLGLFLSREILSITGITIKETSTSGNGARFEMVVPKGTYRFRTSLHAPDSDSANKDKDPAVAV